MRKFRISSGIIFLHDERILINSAEKNIRKYNDSGSKIIALLQEETLSLSQISDKLIDLYCSELKERDIEKFIESLVSNGLVEECLTDG